MKINEDSLRDLWDNIKRNNIHIIGVLGEEREKGPEKIFEEIIVEKFPNMGEEVATQVQEAQRVLPGLGKHRTFHPKTADYTFFSCVHGIFSMIDHILGHKSSLSKFKKIEIISSIFSDHNTMRLEINYRGKKGKKTNTWRLKNTLLNNQEITEVIKEEIKKYRETNDNENTMIQNLCDAAKAVLERSL